MIRAKKKFVVGAGELDQYGHLNCEALKRVLRPSQDALLASRGMTFSAACGPGKFIKRLSIIWLAQLKKGDKCLVVTSLTLGKTDIVFEQRLTRKGSLAVSYITVLTMVGNGRKVPIPMEVKRRLST
ncbi:MAG: hypothetical protein Q7R69_01380 [bacterium]|nr:hypothetical protein [bacterium]